MAASEAADTSFKEVTHAKKSKRLKATPEQKITVKRTHVYTIHITFPAPHTKSKFNPLTSMCTFFKEMLKYDSMITIVILNTNKQIKLANDAIPAMEAEFTKYFMVSTDTRMIDNKSHVIIGCHVTSNRMLREIKFDSTTNAKFMDWLKKEKIFVDLDLLGVQKTVTVGYLLKLHTCLTNHTTLKSLLLDKLYNVHLDPDLAVELDPMLKDQQVAVMSNGDVFVPEHLPFKIYQTKTSYG